MRLEKIKNILFQKMNTFQIIVNFHNFKQKLLRFEIKPVLSHLRQLLHSMVQKVKKNNIALLIIEIIILT